MMMMIALLSTVVKGFVRDLAHTHTKKKMSGKNPIFTNLKKKIRAHRASSKATRLLLTK